MRPIPSTRVIGNIFYIEAHGNHAKTEHFEIAIPDANKLDTNYQGVVAGIKFQETTHVGRAGVRNVALNATTLSFDIFAEGSGIWGAGASCGLRVVAHYHWAAHYTRWADYDSLGRAKLFAVGSRDGEHDRN